MYQGTYARNPRKPKRRAVRMNKTAILLLAVILLAGAVIGTTVAYLTTNTDSITNTFEYAQVSCKVEESFNGTTKSDVTIKNTSNIPAYIRATYVVNWRDTAGNIVAKAPNGYSYSITENTNGTWVKGENNFFYYPTPVDPQKETTGSLLTCTWTCPDEEPECFLHVEIIASAIQSQPASAVQQAWGVTYPLSGN